MIAVVYVAVVLSCLSLVGFLLVIVYISYLRHVKYAHIPGPPVKNFFKGHLKELTLDVKRTGVPHGEFHRQCFVEYGNVILLWLFHFPIICICSPELVREVLVTTNLPKSKMIYRTISAFYGERFLGSGLLTNMDYEDWKIKRRLINPAFHRKYLKAIVPHINSCCDILIKKLLAMADGKTEVNMNDEFSRLTLDIICKVGFGVDLNLILDKSASFTKAFHTALTGSYNAIHNFTLIKFTYSTEEKEAIAAVKYLRDIAQKVINERRQKLKNGANLPFDMLSCILKSCESETISMDSLIDELLTFLFAGHDTTTSHISFSLMEINDNAVIEKKMMQELNNVIGNKRCIVEFDDLPNLKYTEQILKESLRCYPPVNALCRYTYNDCQLAHYFIPKDTTINVSIYAMNHNPDYFEEPYQFIPERWGNIEKSVPYTYLPFSAGPRNCIGQSFAMIEAKLVLTRLLSKIQFSLVPGQTKHVIERLVTKPRDGVCCTMKPRENEQS